MGSCFSKDQFYDPLVQFEEQVTNPPPSAFSMIAPNLTSAPEIDSDFDFISETEIRTIPASAGRIVIRPRWILKVRKKNK